MNAKDRKALERLFAAEMNSQPIVQSKAAIYRELQERGLVEFVTERIYGTGGSVIDRIPMTVSGWRLTLAGRFAYCGTCEGERT